jgi:Domain of unknown function (DUF222)
MDDRARATNVDEVSGLVARIDAGGADADGWREVLAACHRVSSWVEARRLAAVAALDEEPTVFVQQAVADAGRVSLQQGDRVVERAATVTAMPLMGEGLEAGSVTSAHVDVLSAGLRALDAAGKAALAAEHELLATSAESLSVGEFRKLVDYKVRRLQADGGVAELDRQKRNVRMSMWHDRSSKMWHGRFQLDAETGSLLHGRLGRAVEALFHDREPEGCPRDPIEKQGFLRAHALVALCAGGVAGGVAGGDREGNRGAGVDAPVGCGVEGGRVDLAVTVDWQTLRSGLHDHAVMHTSSGADLPLETIRRLACEANIFPVVLNGDSEVLDVGRARRLATKAQRRALRAVFATCFVPGCDMPFDACQVHHLRPFELGGRTDLFDLRPVCSAHHHRLHEGRWTVTWEGFQATITRPDGTTMDTGPPSARAG